MNLKTCSIFDQMTISAILAAILAATHINVYISEIKRPTVMIPVSKYRFVG